MVAKGLTNSAIAGKLALSPWTVSTHLRRIFAKLDVTTRAAMVAVIAADSPTGKP
jgi:DNA-binding CsgD family transcriptional regulator